MNEIRLQKYLAVAGIASRRKADEIIKKGIVEINGKIVTEPWYKVKESDCVKVGGKKIYPQEKMVYIMLNKPLNVVSTTKDEFSRKTVIDLISGVKERIYPVGRLDYETTGLLILTNDGKFAYKLTHPKHEIEKTYIAEVKGIVDNKLIETFKKGIYFDNFKASPAKLKILKRSKDTSILEIKIHEGKKHQIRKMCDVVGYPVISLKRVALGCLKLDNLPEGEWRYLTKEEVENVMNL